MRKQRTITRVLLITGILVFVLSCRPVYHLLHSEYGNQPIAVDFPDADSRMVGLYLPYKHKLDSEMNVVIGYSAREMLKGKPESQLTNYLADIMLEESRLIMEKEGSGIIPDIAFLNHGGIRTGFPRGEIVVKKIFELMPFENELTVLEIKGTELLSFLDMIAAHGGDCLAGASFVIREGRAARVYVGGRQIDPGRLYVLATSDFIADGGDSYSMLQDFNRRVNVSVRIRDMIIAHMSRNYAGGFVIDPVLDGRIRNE
jgi:2',3'-cyclic-nucleotide 2'-phosphodiesterase (5'-nucleotidase family)